MVKNCDRGLENTARGRRPTAVFSRPRLTARKIIVSKFKFFNLKL